MHTSHPRLPGELGFMALVVLFSGFMLWAAYGISKFQSITSAGAFPMWCALTMLVTGLINLVKAARARQERPEGAGPLAHFAASILPAKMAVFAIMVTVYVVVLEPLGFLLSSYLFLVIAMRVLGSRRMGLNALVALLSLAAIYVIFQTAFSVILPPGTLIGPYLPEVLK